MEFVCRIGTPEGRVVEETLQAPDESVARAELERRGCHIFEVRRRGLGRALSLPTLRLRAPRIPMRRLMIFNQELAALLRAGLPLLQALDLMLERLREPQFRRVLGEIRDRVRSGEDLSDAVAAFGGLFPALYASSLKAGERSGELEPVIRRFMRYQRLVMDARKRVVSALVYPAVLVVLSALMIAVMMIYVVPRFTVFYADMEAELPLITRVTLGISFFVKENWPLFALAALAGGLGIRQWGRTASGSVTLDAWKLRLPFVGPIFHRFALSEFCRALATLLAGGIPLVPALEIAARGVGNAHIRAKLEPAIQGVREGSAFHQVLEGSGVFTDLAVDMVRVGEATGSLDAMLSNVSDFFDEEVETQTQRLLSLVEPVLLVLMGVIVATLLVSVYLPMLSVLGQVNP